MPTAGSESSPESIRKGFSGNGAHQISSTPPPPDTTSTFALARLHKNRIRLRRDAASGELWLLRTSSAAAERNKKPRESNCEIDGDTGFWLRATAEAPDQKLSK